MNIGLDVVLEESNLLDYRQLGLSNKGGIQPNSANGELLHPYDHANGKRVGTPASAAATIPGNPVGHNHGKSFIAQALQELHVVKNCLPRTRLRIFAGRRPGGRQWELPLAPSFP